MKTDRWHWIWRHLPLLGVAIGCGVQVLVAQTREDLERSDPYGRFGREGTTPVVQPQGIALGSIIDPSLYYVGPSDVFSVNIWTTPPMNFVLSVTPEGTLIIPTVAEVKVADETLERAKELVKEKIGVIYSRSTQSSVTLTIPRSVVVFLTGNVLNPGTFIMGAHQRVSDAVEAANRLRENQLKVDLDRVLRTMSTRTIIVRHKDGSTSPVDIDKYYGTKDDRLNPYLREGDVVVIPQKDPERGYIGVYGRVNVPGRFEFVNGDSISDAISLAQGLTEAAIRDSVEFTRMTIDGDSLITEIVNLEEIHSRAGMNRPLQLGDRIVVGGRSDLRTDYRVTVRGEVLFPGTYPITKSQTRLSEIIKKAGGFTEFASIRTSELRRKPVSPEEISIERLQSARGGVRAEDSLYYYLETDLRIRKELVGVDFSSLFEKGDSTQDVTLRDGDIVEVPFRRNTIYVFGQVVSPGNVEFLDGADAAYYVGKAGGFTDRARPDDIRIVKARTRQWLYPDDTVIEEGDHVWVPKETEYPFSYYMAIIGQTASIISVALSVIILTVELTK